MKRVIFILILMKKFSFAQGISPSVLMFHEWDLNDCEARTQKALEYNKESIHFLLAGQFRAYNKRVESYCFNTEDAKCTSVSEKLIKSIKNKMHQCFNLVPDGAEINISFHLNDTKGDQSVWRNEIVFDPLEKYNGFSYEEFLIKPILLALDPQKKHAVRLSLQGEMGATIFSYPLSYLEIIKKLQMTYSNYKFGISTNYNKLSGGVKGYNIDNIQKLINSLDFLGFSAYRPFNPLELKNVFSKHVENYLKRLKALSLIVPGKVELLFSEIGLGGGNWINDGKTPGTNIEEVSGAPYAGIYVEGMDNNPWENEELFFFRRKFFLFLKSFLNSEIKIKNHEVRRAFIWNASSWDIHGIYPGSENFKDHYLGLKLGSF